MGAHQNSVDVSRYADHIEGHDVDEPRANAQVPVGQVLEEARQRVGLAPEAAAALLHISERDLLHYEAGLRTAPPSLINDMADLYGVKTEFFGTRLVVPRASDARVDETGSTLWLGPTAIPLETGTAKNRHLIRSVATALRSMRKLDESEPLYLREKELPMIGDLLDMDDPDLKTLIMHWFRLTLAEASDVIDKMQAPDEGPAGLFQPTAVAVAPSKGNNRSIFDKPDRLAIADLKPSSSEAPDASMSHTSSGTTDVVDPDLHVDEVPTSPIVAADRQPHLRLAPLDAHADEEVAPIAFDGPSGSQAERPTIRLNLRSDSTAGDASPPRIDLPTDR